ncbi:MAG: HU family DNA-binding protein [Bryobacteraceae bacterium]|nr:HU family DNA-binding protein [Bryobacteraceae bacterium]
MERLIHRLAEASNSPPEEVADNLDKLIASIRKRLRSGRPVRLPGLGTLTPGPRTQFRQEDAADAKKRSPNGRIDRPDH